MCANLTRMGRLAIHTGLSAVSAVFNRMLGEIGQRNVALDSAHHDAERLRAIVALNRIVFSSLDTDAVLTAIARAAATLMASPVVAFWLADEAAGTLERRALSDETYARGFTAGRLRFGESGVGAVAATRHPLQVDNVLADPRFTHDWWQLHGLRSFLGVPVVRGDKLLAVLALHGRRSFTLRPDQHELLEMLTAQAAAAIRYARVYTESIRRGQRLEALAAVTRSITESLDPERILPAITDAALSLFPGAACRVWIVEDERVRLRAEAGVRTVAAGELREMALGQGIVGAVCATAAPLTIETVGEHPNLGNGEWMRAQGIESAAILPLVELDRCLGAFALLTRERHVFTLDEVSLLQAFAEHAAVALEKARLFHEAEERRRVTEALYAMTLTMQRSMDLGDRLQAFVRHAGDVLGFDRINVLLATPDATGLCLEAGTDVGPDDHRVIAFEDGAEAFGEAWRSGRTLIVNDDPACTAPLAPAWLPHPVLRPRRFALVPLTFGERPIGLVTAGTNASDRPLTARAVSQLELFCQQLAQSVSNARLYAETQEQKIRLEQIFSSTSDGILVLDLAGSVIALNRQGAAFLGVVPEHVVGCPFTALVERLGETLAAGGSDFRSLLEAGPRAAAADLEIRLPVPRTLRWQATPTQDATGTPVGLTVSLRDVTREREVDRMKTEFVSIVSHELRTPLTSIKGSLHLLMTDPAVSDNEDQRQLVEISLKNTDRLIRLINDILDVSKMEAGRIQLRLGLQAVAEWVGTSVEGIHAFADSRGIRIETELADGLPPVLVDPDRMVQVVTNLLSNAVKFSPEGSRVWVTARRAGDTVELRVRDEGRGIGAEDIPKLFEKFRQLDSRSVRAAGGTGLGLAICRGLVEEHGGRIWVESTPGEGATFIVVLPVHTPGVVTPAATAAPPGEAPPVILLVDDEAEIRAVLREHLELVGYRVLEAASALEAIELARAHCPDLITMDLMLPDLDGLEAMRLLAADDATRGIPVVVVTGIERGEGEPPAVPSVVSKAVGESVLLSAILGKLGRGSLTGAPHVLVADDDPDVRMVLGRTLGQAGFRVATAVDGKEAPEAIAAARPDLVLLDLQMPLVNGYEVLRALRAAPATRSLPVIILTASEARGGEERAAEAGATEYLRKPFNAEDLISRIRAHLPGEGGRR